MKKLTLLLLLLPAMHGTAHASEAYAAQVNPYYQQPAQQPAQVAVSNPYPYYYPAPAQAQMQPQAAPTPASPQQPSYTPPTPQERQINILQMNSF